MWKLRIFCPRCTCRLLVALILALAVAADSTEIKDFISFNTLPDGEVETRIYYKGVTAKETSVGKGSNTGIKFRQLTDGKNLLQLIYDEINSLTDCEIVHQRKQARKFLFNFKNDLRRLVATSNITIQSLDGRSLPEQFQYSIQFDKLKMDCRKKHQQMKVAIEEARNTKNSQRSKRDISDLLRMPGTKWCGKGYSADKYTRLGGFSRTDKCCRRHDTSCPFWIGAFETRYGLFNWRVNTIMHCSCDERFRACLKMVDSSDANLVGKLFFNIVQTKCFVLKPRKKCIRSSWWGKCEKFRYVKFAVLRDNIPY